MALERIIQRNLRGEQVATFLESECFRVRYHLRVKSRSNNLNARVRGDQAEKANRLASIERQVATLEDEDYGYARSAIWRLATLGCDVALVWLGLRAYVIEGQSARLHTVRSSYKEVKKKLSAVGRKIGRVLAGIRREAKAGKSLELQQVFTPFEIEVAGIEEQIANVVRNVLKSVSDARGLYRKEAYLAAVAIYLRNQTNRPCYSEMSSILDCVAASCSRDDATQDAENIRRTCERYLDGEDAIEKAEIVLGVIFEGICDDHFSVILRKRLLATSVPTQVVRRTRTATKSRDTTS